RDAGHDRRNRVEIRHHVDPGQDLGGGERQSGLRIGIIRDALRDAVPLGIEVGFGDLQNAIADQVGSEPVQHRPIYRLDLHATAPPSPERALPSRPGGIRYGDWAPCSFVKPEPAVPGGAPLPSSFTAVTSAPSTGSPVVSRMT